MFGNYLTYLILNLGNVLDKKYTIDTFDFDTVTTTGLHEIIDNLLAFQDTMALMTLVVSPISIFLSMIIYYFLK